MNYEIDVSQLVFDKQLKHSKEVHEQLQNYLYKYNKYPSEIIITLEQFNWIQESVIIQEIIKHIA